MKIASGSIQLSSEHNASSRYQEQERITVGRRFQSLSTSAPVKPSQGSSKADR